MVFLVAAAVQCKLTSLSTPRALTFCSSLWTCSIAVILLENSLAMDSPSRCRLGIGQLHPCMQIASLARPSLLADVRSSVSTLVCFCFAELAGCAPNG